MHIAVHMHRPTYTIYYKLYTFMYRFLGGYVLFLQFLWLLFLSLVCRNVVWWPQPGTTLLQYIHWLCTQVMAMMNDDVMIECFFLKNQVFLLAHDCWMVEIWMPLVELSL